jgi:emfourin
MRIEVRQQGGFAGLRPAPQIVDTTDLDPRTAGEIERIATTLPAGTGQSHGADLMRYDVTVGDRTTTYHEPDVPPAVRKLLVLARDAGRNA